MQAKRGKNPTLTSAHERHQRNQSPVLYGHALGSGQIGDEAGQVIPRGEAVADKQHLR